VGVQKKKGKTFNSKPENKKPKEEEKGKKQGSL
jgi:hypothetical protein